MDAIALWVRDTIFPPLEWCVGICLRIWIFALLPMLVFRKTRKWAAVGFLYSSLLTGFACWVFSGLATYRTLGAFGFLFGIALMGIGVIPLAFVGVAVRGDWAVLPDLFFAVGVAILPVVVGGLILRRYGED